MMIGFSVKGNKIKVIVNVDRYLYASQLALGLSYMEIFAKRLCHMQLVDESCSFNLKGEWSEDE